MAVADIRRSKRPPSRAHLVVPACLSGLLLLVFFPLILRLQPDAVQGATGRSPRDYLTMWLLFTAASFLASGLGWALRIARHRLRSDSRASYPRAADTSTRPTGS